MEMISIIVPVYNVSAYLEQCINSILNQKYYNYEVILVDDGSTDKSGIICDRYAEKYNCIRVIHKQNGGLSDARNHGLDIARGSYICFIDSDDYVSENYLSVMYRNLIENEVDISCCGFSKVYDNGKQIYNLRQVREKYCGEDIQIYLNVDGYFNVAVWNKLYKKSLFKKRRFPVGKNSEDAYIQCHIMNEAKSLFYDSTPEYYYRQRGGSITKSTSIIYDTMKSNELQYQFYQDNRLMKALPYGGQRLLLAYIGVYNNLLCKTVLSADVTKESIRVLALKYRTKFTYQKLPAARKIQIFLFLHFIAIYNVSFKLFNFRRSLLLGNFK